MGSSRSTQNTEQTSTKTILIVENDDAIGEVLVRTIQFATPYQAVLASNGLEALARLHSLKPALLVLDQNLPDMTGLELYDLIHTTRTPEQLPVLLISAYPLKKEAAMHNLPFLQKPFELAVFLINIEELIT